MDLMQDLLTGNRDYQTNAFTPQLAEQPAKPRRRLAVVACMDARYVPERVLGLEPGESIVIRTAGAVVDEGVLRSLVAAIHLLDVDTIVHMAHTDCGLKGLHENSEALMTRLETHLGADSNAGQLQETLLWLQPFKDTLQHAKDSLSRIQIHALIPSHVAVHGLVYDNKTGAVEVVT